eukprot:1157307-Pelagomonas_calceolata.AAC.2
MATSPWGSLEKWIKERSKADLYRCRFGNMRSSAPQLPHRAAYICPKKGPPQVDTRANCSCIVAQDMHCAAVGPNACQPSLSLLGGAAHRVC